MARIVKALRPYLTGELAPEIKPTPQAIPTHTARRDTSALAI